MPQTGASGVDFRSLFKVSRPDKIQVREPVRICTQDFHSDILQSPDAYEIGEEL